MTTTTTQGEALLGSASVPVIYQLIMMTIEPIFAILGAVMTLHAPHQYLAGLTRNVHPFEENTRCVFTQLSGSWLFVAFTEGVVLRLFDDVKLWRVVCAGMLVSDAAYRHSAAQAVGGWEQWLRYSEWTVEDHVIFWSTAPMVLVRILIVLGVGIKTSSSSSSAAASRAMKSE